MFVVHSPFCVDTSTSNDIPYAVMSDDISLIVDLQSYARQLTILTNRTLAPGVCSALIPQEMVISSPQKGCLS